MKLPKIFVPEKDLEDEVERLLKKEIKPSETHLKYSKFEVIHADTYAGGIAKLKEQGQKPFTFSENIEARIADYEINCGDTELFDTWLDSVTGVAYKANSTKFKIILRSDKLENIKPDFRQSFIPVDYNAENGIELDSTKGKYNQQLTREEAKNHEFWLAAINGDKGKLTEYVDMWFDKTGKNRGMSVYLRSNTRQDELRALVLDNDLNSSGASGYYYLEYDVCLVSGAQQKKLLYYKRK